MKKLGCIAKDIRKVGKVIQEVNPDIVINAADTGIDMDNSICEKEGS